jgi:predicted nucleic acid-binding protein
VSEIRSIIRRPSAPLAARAAGPTSSSAAEPGALRYLDASALVKRYVAEPGAEPVRALLSGGLLATARITEVEVASALARRCREGFLAPPERERALVALRRDLAQLFVVELSPEVVSRGVALLSRLPLRAADAVQLASCLELRDRLEVPCLFVCCDERLLAAARQEGLATAP